MASMDDFFWSLAREHQRQREQEARDRRMARLARRAARAQAARQEPSPGPAAQPPQATRPHDVRACLAALRPQVSRLRRRAGYTLVEAGLRLLTPASRRSDAR